MGAVFEWYQANQSTSYPFVDRQADDTHELFVDAYVAHHRYVDTESNVRLAAYDFGMPASITLEFVNGDPLATITEGDTGVIFTTTAFGNYTIYEWTKSTTIAGGFTEEDLTARLVVITSKLADFPTSASLVDGQLVSSTVNPYPRRVRRLFVKRALSATLDLVTHPRVVFEAGNNLQFSVESAIDPDSYGLTSAVEARAPSVITIDAEAGLGTGADYRCDLAGSIKTINGVGPDERGNFVLDGKDCTWVERPMKDSAPPVHPYTDVSLTPDNARWPAASPTQIGPGVILHQSCQACCACEDYVNAYQAMYTLWVRAQAASARVAAVQTQFNSVCQTVKAGEGKVPEGVNIWLMPMSRPDFSLALSGILFNNSAAALGTVQVDIVVDQPSTYLDYVARSGYLDIGTDRNLQVDPLVTAVGSTTKLTIVLSGVQIGEFARFGAVVRFNSNMASRASAVVTCTATATWSGGTASDVQRSQLSPPLSKT